MEILRDLTYGMYIISTKYNEKNIGCFVNTVTQITASSNIIAVSVNKENYTNKALKEGKRFSVSILSEKTNSELIGKFGFFSSKDTDKFENVEYIQANNIPVVIENMCGYLICEVIDVISVDTHDIFLAKIVDTKKINNFVPMTYSYYHEVIKGSAPKTAPTYMEEKQESTSIKYKCIICGHIYDEIATGIKFEDLPDDWKCPICGVGKEMFRKMEE